MTEQSYIIEELGRIVNAALDYARRGIPVFPCRERTTHGPDLDRNGKPKEHHAKSPYTQHGCHDATTDADQITRWWKRYPNAAIGLRTGTSSGLFVVDVDVKNGGQGAETWAALQAQHGQAPLTRTVRTASGGWHYYYRHPGQGKAVKTDSGSLGPGLDLRGDGNGYVLAAGSVIESGNYFYEHDIPTAEAPDWLLELAVKKPRPEQPGPRPTFTASQSTRYAERALKDECGILAVTPEGQRHGQLFKSVAAIGGLIAGGELLEQEARAAIMAAVASWGTGAESEDKTLDTIEDALEKGMSEPRTAPDGESGWNPDSGQRAGGGVTEWPDPAPLEYRPRVVPEFDAETLLPDALRGWITDEAGRMPCPVEFVAVSALVSIGSLVGTRCGIKPKQKDEWLELPNLWGGVCGVPSTKKTPSLNAGTSMLFRLAAEESERFEQAQKEFQDLLTVGEIEQAEVKKQLSRAVKARLDGAKDADEKAHIQAMKDIEGRLLESTPTKRRYSTTDSSGAKLGDLLVNNPLGLMVYRDELGGLLSKLDHPDNAEERAFYLEGFGGKSGYAIDRMERGELWVPNVCLSVLGGIQPDKLVGYMNRAFRQGGNDGLLQRFGMLVYPEPIKWKYVDRLPDKASRDRAWTVFQKLNDFDPVEWGAAPPDDFCRFCRFGFDADAQKIFIEWLEWLQCEVLAKEENPNLEEHFTKYQKMVPALALIFHLVECADSGQRGPVGASSMVRAAAWGELLMEHARKAYGLLVDAGLSGAVALSKRLMAGAVQNGFSARDIHVKGWSGLTDIETVKAAIDVLVNEGWLRPVTVQTGGRKKDAFEINPKLMAVAA